MASERIPIVEDQPMISALYRRFLGGMGYEVYTADSGERALEMLDSVRPGAILMDIQLPGIDGLETTRRMRGAMRRQAPVIFLTGEDDPEMLVKGLEAGGDDYVLKCGGLKDMARRIERWLAREDESELPRLRKETLSRVKLAVR